MCLGVKLGNSSGFQSHCEALIGENMMDFLPALTLSFTEEHLQGCGSHTLRTFLFPFVGKKTLICGCV